jgi:hypothetical protein
MSVRTLKIKIKSLAAEAKIIRREERKTKPQIEWKEMTFPNGATIRYQAGEYFELHTHRTGPVRASARHALLAYGYLRGRAYKQLEAKCYDEPDWQNVLNQVKRFDPSKSNLVPDQFKEWRDAA